MKVHKKPLPQKPKRKRVEIDEKDTQAFLNRPVQKLEDLDKKLRNSYDKEFFKKPRFSHFDTLKKIRKDKENDSIKSQNKDNDSDFKVSKSKPRNRNKKKEDSNSESENRRVKKDKVSNTKKDRKKIEDSSSSSSSSSSSGRSSSLSSSLQKIKEPEPSRQVADQQKKVRSPIQKDKQPIVQQETEPKQMVLKSNNFEDQVQSESSSELSEKIVEKKENEGLTAAQQVKTKQKEKKLIQIAAEMIFEQKKNGRDDHKESKNKLNKDDVGPLKEQQPQKSLPNNHTSEESQDYYLPAEPVETNSHVKSQQLAQKTTKSSPPFSPCQEKASSLSSLESQRQKLQLSCTKINLTLNAEKTLTLNAEKTINRDKTVKSEKQMQLRHFAKKTKKSTKLSKTEQIVKQEFSNKIIENKAPQYKQQPEVQIIQVLTISDQRQQQQNSFPESLKRSYEQYRKSSVKSKLSIQDRVVTEHYVIGSSPQTNNPEITFQRVKTELKWLFDHFQHAPCCHMFHQNVVLKKNIVEEEEIEEGSLQKMQGENHSQ